eukprot:1148495-Pelagomonas_calceolata.AAC.6
MSASVRRSEGVGHSLAEYKITANVPCAHVVNRDCTYHRTQFESSESSEHGYIPCMHADPHHVRPEQHPGQRCHGAFRRRPPDAAAQPEHSGR